METHAEHILQTALALPATERAEIAASLIESLDSAVDAEVDAAWADEVKRRIESIDSGQVQLIPWDDVIGSMRARSNS
jgi:putative addiction module component (TIGR02574 family)